MFAVACKLPVFLIEAIFYNTVKRACFIQQELVVKGTEWKGQCSLLQQLGLSVLSANFLQNFQQFMLLTGLLTSENLF
jgi:hypothetical protein